MRRLRPLWIGLGLSAFLLLSVRHFWPGFLMANESIRYFFVAAVVEDGTVQLDREFERYHSHNVDRAERGGHIYLDKAPGVSVLAVPAYWVWTRVLHRGTPRPPPQPIDRLLFFLTLFAATLPTLAAAALLAKAAERNGISARIAGAFVVALLCATPLGIYATQFFGHATAAAGLMAAFALVEVDALDIRRAALAGFCAAAAVACEYTAALPAAGIAVLAFLRGRWRGVAAFALAGLPVAVALGAYHWAAFGSPLRAGYAFKTESNQAAHYAQGFYGMSLPQPAALYGLLLGRELGLWFFAPWLALAGLGIYALWRTRRATAIFLAFTCLSTLLLIASFNYWNNPDCVGPRFLVIAMPFWAYAALFAPRAFADERLRRATIVVGGGLAAASLVQLWFAHATFPFHLRDVIDPLYTVSAPLLFTGHLAPGPLSWLPWPVVAILPPLIVLAGSAWLVGRRKWIDVAGAALVVVVWFALVMATSPGWSPAIEKARRITIDLMT